MTIQQQFASQRARKKRENVSGFKALIATPVTDGAVGLLPAGGHFKLVATAIRALGSDALTIVSSTTRIIQSPGLQIGESMLVDWVEEGANVTIATGFELYVNAGLDRFLKIGELA